MEEVEGEGVYSVIGKSMKMTELCQFYNFLFFHALGKGRAQRWVDIAGQGSVCNQVLTNIKIGENPFNCYVQ